MQSAMSVQLCKETVYDTYAILRAILTPYVNLHTAYIVLS